MLDSKKNYISINGILICLNNLSKNIKTFNDIIINFNNILQNQNHNLDIYKNYYIINNGKLYDKYTKITNLLNLQQPIIYFYIHERLNGGGGFFEMLGSIFYIGEFFISIGEFFAWLGKFVLWLIKFVLWLFSDLLNPMNFGNSFFNSLMALVIGICRIPFDVLLGLLSLSINTVGGWMQGFWGWDQSSLTKADMDSNYFKKINRSSGKKCYLTQTNTVPFSVILGTILCPPIGVFMDMGLTGWLNILICILLTLLFYIPGLVYALLIIYA